jgi:YD repeat-containing protein
MTYDASGNLTSNGTRTLEWDGPDRLTAVTTGTHCTEFTYDGLSGRARIVEKENGTTVRDAWLVWEHADLIEERLSIGEISRIYNPSAWPSSV